MTSSSISLEGRVIVITGASAGLGAGMASWFADRGASLGLCARRTPDPVGESVVTRSVDVAQFAGLRSFAGEVAQRLGPIDLWVNNAAVLDPIVRQRELDADALAEHLAINVVGVLNGTRAYLHQLEADAHRGALVNITSGLAQKGRAGLSAYAAAKAGVDRLTEVVALEEPKLLRVALAVSPGVIDTGMQATLRQQDSDVLHDVDMFRQLRAEEAMSSPGWVARNVAGWVFGDARPDGVVVRVPPEPDA